jgi:hypothetical protein
VLTSDIERLEPHTHAELGLREDLDFAFARGHSVAPLMLSEIGAASVWYPIVFTEEAPQPVAVLGLHSGPNLYVRADGGWRWNAYVPAAFRRHPFLLEEAPDRTLHLCVRNPREHLARGGRRFFADGAPTALYTGAFEFCCNLMAEAAETAKFVDALRERRLLAPRTASVRTHAGATVQQSFLTIDERKLRELDAGAFSQLRREGWLSAIFAQLNSTLNWHKIGDLCARAEAAPPRAEGATRSRV